MDNYKRFSQSDSQWNQIVDLCQSGDSSAFKELMETHYKYAYAVAFKILHNEFEAQEIVQETFVRIWKNISSYQAEKKFTTWLYKIAVNLCYDKLKADSRKRKHISNIDESSDEIRVIARESAERDIENKDMGELIVEISKTLPPKQNMVFSLRDLQDFSLEEIAKTTGMSINSIKTNLCYARRYIRQKLEELEN